jgi:SHS2 domain-containing protein
MPFEEVQHTADWSLRVWAGNLPELYSESARGMYALSGTHLVTGPRICRLFESRAPDPESMLVAFLSELVFISEREKLAFDEFEVKISGDHLYVQMVGAPILSINKAIKAVTYHNLQIRCIQKGCEVEIVFDV